MSDIGKGDWIICVCPDGDGHHRVEAGGVYHVANVGRKHAYTEWYCPICHEVDGAVLDLTGFPVHPNYAHCRCCFRPLGRPPGEVATTTRRSKTKEPA